MTGVTLMPTRRPNLSKEEHALRGTAIYENQIRAQIEKNNYGKVVAIDVETGEFDLDEETLPAAEKLLARCPHAQIWFVRIGHRGLHKFGNARARRAHD
jgi:hypothetical protein